MKPLAAAAFAALMATAGTAGAQPYPQPGAPAWSSANPYDGPAHYAPDNGPQYRWMMTHGSTVNDAMAPDGSDAFSNALNAEEAAHPRYYIIYPAGPGPEDY